MQLRDIMRMVQSILKAIGPRKWSLTHRQFFQSLREIFKSRQSLLVNVHLLFNGNETVHWSWFIPSADSIYMQPCGLYLSAKVIYFLLVRIRLFIQFLFIRFTWQQWNSFGYSVKIFYTIDHSNRIEQIRLAFTSITMTVSAPYAFVFNNTVLYAKWYLGARISIEVAQRTIAVGINSRRFGITKPAEQKDMLSKTRASNFSFVIYTEDAKSEIVSLRQSWLDI